MRSAPLLLLLLILTACHDDPSLPSLDAAPRDASDAVTRELAARDLGAPSDARADAPGGDLSATELGAPDLAKPMPDGAVLDLAKPDAAAKPDLTSKPDLGKPDLAKPDLAKPEASSPTGLKVPCQRGPGFTLFRFHYGGGGTSPSIDVWDATCSYSYAPSSACNVVAVYPGFGSVSYTSQGFPILTSTEYLRVRFSVAGLSFSKATIHLQARSYATSSSTSFRIWSPLHGDAIGGPVDNDWVYDWYSLDWTGYLTPSDPPSLTAIQLYAHQGSGQLAVQAVELCVQ
jgi:hypothetical protein